MYKQRCISDTQSSTTPDPGKVTNSQLDTTNERCATTHRQTTDRKSTRRQSLTDKKIFTDSTTERQRQVADTTTYRRAYNISLQN